MSSHMIDGGWKPASAAKGHRTFTRALGLTETSFYWDSLMNGTADTLSIYTIRLAPSETSASERFSQSWIAARRHYPLLGARVEESADREASFVIDEEALGQLHEDNFVFQDISSEREVDVTVELHLNNVRKLSQTILSKCIIMRRTDEPNMYHVLFQVAHLITDGMANYSLARMFFNTLASSSPFSVIPDLQSRLRAVPSQESIMPVYAMSRPRQRWRRAIAFALWQGYQRKMTGGHTIPNRITPETLWTPARSCAIHVRLPEHVSARISRTCRVNGITVGHAHPLLAQLAMSRVLHRRYARGEISQEDWERRLREPTHTGGPLNLRPFLAGRDGALNEEFNLCISFFFATMPFMPGASSAARDETGAPAFGDILSRPRFFLRAKAVKRQVSSFMQHPLFLEMTLARSPSRAARVRDSYLQWKAMQEGKPIVASTEVSMFTTASGGLIFQNGGSSFGVIDRLLPISYPSSVPAPASGTADVVPPVPDSTAPAVTAASSPGAVTILAMRTHLRCRPTELYLGCATVRGQMVMNVFYDGNSFDDDVVEEWLHEVRDAAVHYLGQPEREIGVSAKL